MKYRKKPVVIEATQFDGENVSEILRFCNDGKTGEQVLASGAVFFSAHGTLRIQTLEGSLAAKAGDYIIKGVTGELYPCKPDIFAATHEPVEDDTPIEQPTLANA